LAQAIVPSLQAAVPWARRRRDLLLIAVRCCGTLQTAHIGGKPPAELTLEDEEKLPPELRPK
jgi:hypothetical protein